MQILISKKIFYFSVLSLFWSFGARATELVSEKFETISEPQAGLYTKAEMIAFLRTDRSTLNEEERNALAQKLVESNFRVFSEAELTQLLIDAFIAPRINKARDAHPKTHGCVDEAKVTIKGNLGELQKGLFSEAGKTYEAILRPSSGQSDPQADDRMPGTQGLALKVLAPEGESFDIPEIPEEGDLNAIPADKRKYYKSFDILTISGIHEFMVSSVYDYPEFFSAVGAVGAIRKKAADGELPEEVLPSLIKNVFNSQYFHLSPPGMEDLFPGMKKRPVEAALVGQSGAQNVYDPFNVSYQSWVPSLLGSDKAVKYQIKPISCPHSEEHENLLKGEALMTSLGVQGDKNRLREVLKVRLTQAKNCFELGVHELQEGHENLVEKAELPWPGKDLPDAYVPVALIEIPEKEEGYEFFRPGEDRENGKDDFCQSLSFNPGHAPLEHYPIGGIQRARIKIYATIQALRNKQVREAQEQETEVSQEGGGLDY